MVMLTFQEICDRIRQMTFPEVDLVVGIGSGGVVPASVIAFHLKKGLSVVTINYRDDNNTPRHDEPMILNLPEKLLLGSPAAGVSAIPVKITGNDISHQSPPASDGTLLNDRDKYARGDEGVAYGRLPELHDRKRILLVDDVSVSGKTLQTAKELLSGHIVTTFTLKGKADLVLFPEIGDCVKWPWKS